MSSAAFPAPRPVLADLVPGSLARDAALVAGAALLTAAAAQVVVPLPFTPVPISGQTFAVLLCAAALGPLRGSLAQGLYLLLGMLGLPFYAGGESGWQAATGATGGYLIGFVAASVVVGTLARRGLDRSAVGMAAAFLAGSVVVYAFGAPFLAVVAGVTLPEAVRLGVAPFLVGDLVKALLAAGLVPAAWRVANSR
ncbi:MAG: biotin transporter BioY [Euzebyaceae bacterium]|nr:biotin transporter BioY [Euzebyaceae bacterium]